MTQIHILSATDRPNSNALKVSNYIEPFLSEKAKVKVFSLKDFPLQDVAGGRYGNVPESVKRFNTKFLDADGFLFVIPEYNGGFPGILKLFIDYLPFPESMYKKPVCLIGESAGAFGALRPVEQFQNILLYRNAHIFPKRIFIQRVRESFDENSGLKSEKQEERLQKQLREFPDFVESIISELVDA